MKAFLYEPLRTFDAAVDMTRCRANISVGAEWPGSHQCYYKVTVTDTDGIGWCKQHDPVAMTRRSEERAAKYEEQRAKQRRERERPQRLEALLRRTLAGVLPPELRAEIDEELGRDG